MVQAQISGQWEKVEEICRSKNEAFKESQMAKRKSGNSRNPNIFPMKCELCDLRHWKVRITPLIMEISTH